MAADNEALKQLLNELHKHVAGEPLLHVTRVRFDGGQCVWPAKPATKPKKLAKAKVEGPGTTTSERADTTLPATEGQSAELVALPTTSAKSFHERLLSARL